MAPSINEFEDLTQFADESFDTEEVDLFEFAEDEDSPLLRLKSIVLSLDWDITEDILTELSEELANLKALWRDDKVAQIYLQGMDNVGQYLQTEGAYAHPNAIKLLLTLYYNYEKIISSSSISGENITTMLKADIRKFKVLQYQISEIRKARTEEQAPEPVAVAVEEEKQEIVMPEPEKPSVGIEEEQSNIPEPLRSMEATILGLEWEVTDEGLEKFHQEASELRQHLTGNKEAQVLVQGLQALGSYIREQTTNAHPDSFTILHSFYDALKMLLDGPDLSAEQRRQILVEQIGSLNSLKDVIAKSAATGGAAASPKAEPAPESVQKAAQPAPEKKAAPATPSEKRPPVQEELIAGADSAEDDMDLDGLFAEDDENPVQFDTGELEDTSDDLFAESSPEKQAAAPDEDEDDDDWSGDNLFGSTPSGVTPALADEDEEGGFSTQLKPGDLSEERAAELDQKLDSFFDFGDEETSETSQETASQKDTENIAVEQEKEDAATSKQSASVLTLDDDEEGEDELDSFFNFDDDDSPASDPAQLSVDEEAGSVNSTEDSKSQTIAALIDEGDDEEGDEGDDPLDSFFNFDDDDSPAALSDDTQEDEKQETVAEAAEEDSLDSFFSFDDDEDEISVPAETAAEEESETVAALSDEGEEDGLDAFLSLDDDDDTSTSATDEETDSLSLDDIDELDADSFFEDEAGDVEEPETVAALSDESEEDGLEAFLSLDDDDDITGPETAEAAEEEPEMVAALSDEGEEDELDSFLDLDEDTDISATEAETEDTEAALSLEDTDALDSDSFFEDEVAEESETVAALANEDEDDGLDSFLDLDEDTDISATEAETEDTEAGLSLDDADTLDSDSFFEDESSEAEELETVAALADEGEDDGFFNLDEDIDDISASELESESAEASLSLDADELDSDSFFEDEAAKEEEPEMVAALSEEGEDDGLDSFLDLDEDTDISATEAETEDTEAALSLDDADTLDSDSFFEDESSESETVAALADEGDDEGFFNLDEDTDDISASEPESAEAGLSLDADDELDSDSFFEDESSEAEESETVAALADEGEDNGFFNLDEDTDDISASELESESAEASLSLDADELDSDSFFEDEAAKEEEPEMVAALADEGDDKGFFNLDDDTDTSTAEPEAEEAESFFGEAEEPESMALGEGIGKEQATEINNKLDSLFNFDDDEFSTDEGDELTGQEEDTEELSQEKVSEEDFIDSFGDGELDSNKEEKPQEAEDDVFVIAQGEDASLSEFDSESEFDNLLDENEEDDVASVVSKLAETEIDDVSFSEATQEDTATQDDELFLSKDYEAASEAFAEEPEGLLSQFDQDSLPDAFAGNEFVQKIIEKTEAPGSDTSVFSSLILAAAALSPTSSAHDLQQVSELAVAAQKEETLAPNKNILLNLLGSSSAMLAKAPKGEVADHGRILVQELAAGLNDSSSESSMLSGVIGRYTAWQKDFFEQLINGGSDRSQESNAKSELHQLQNEMTQLKQDLLSEIRSLRQELGKG